MLNNTADWKLDVRVEFHIATYVTHAHLGAVLELLLDQKIQIQTLDLSLDYTKDETKHYL